MVVMVGIGPRNPSLTHEEFARLWAGRHADIVRHLPGLRGYIQHHAFPGHPHPGFDTLAELYFDTEDDLKAAFRSDYYRDVVAPDEERLVIRDRMTGSRMTAGETPAAAAAPAPAAALVHLHRSDPPPQPSPSGARRLRPLPSDRSGFTAVDVIECESPEAAIQQASVSGGIPTRPLRIV